MGYIAVGFIVAAHDLLTPQARETVMSDNDPWTSNELWPGGDTSNELWSSVEMITTTTLSDQPAARDRSTAWCPGSVLSQHEQGQDPPRRTAA